MKNKKIIKLQILCKTLCVTRYIIEYSYDRMPSIIAFLSNLKLLLLK